MNLVPLPLLALCLIAAVRAQCPHMAALSMSGDRVYKTVTTTTSTITVTSSDANPEKAEKPTYNVDLVRKILDKAKQNGNVAPKVFFKYFKAKPASMKAFPAISGLALSDLPRNGAFLSNVYTCFAGLKAYTLETDVSTRCPVFAKASGKYKSEDIDLFTSILKGVVAEELGADYDDVAKEAFEQFLDAVALTVTK